MTVASASSFSLTKDSVPISDETSRQTFIESASSFEVGERLLAYLKRHWRLNRLAFSHQPEVVPHGWETFTFRFQLAAASGLPAKFTHPLILRIYANKAGTSCAYREWQIEDYLAPFGYPVPECIVLERSSEVFGGPFLVSEQAPGEPFPDYLFASPLAHC